ncbi:MAG: hypothetical protein J6S53_01790 [Lentisphaeria bacterium]|nr:hypothetical protein [Lentisphaeria bacterium]
MNKKTVAKTELLLQQEEKILPSFAMYFVHGEKDAVCLAEECLFACVEKWRNNELTMPPRVFLYREIRKKCFEYLGARGKHFESSFVLSEEKLKNELSSGEERGKLYEDLLLLAESLSFLQEQEREILFLMLFCSLSKEECAFVLDKSTGDVEEVYLLALMKLNTGLSAGKEMIAEKSAGEMIKLTGTITFLLSKCGQYACLKQENKEKILLKASAEIPFDYRKAVYKSCAVLLFCVITAGLLIHSHIQGEPELQPEVKMGVFMPEEERRENLLQEKARQEKILSERRKDLTAVQLSIRNFSSSGRVPDPEKAEKRLKKLGVTVKIHRVEKMGTNREKIYLYVAPADALKISRCKKLLK